MPFDPWVTAVSVDDEQALLTLDAGDQQRELSARLLVAADGVKSFIRDAMQLPVRRWEYGQSAVVANITPERPHRQVAYERFTDTGPLALLLLGHVYFTYVYKAWSSMATGYVPKEDMELEHSKWLEELEHEGAERSSA